MPTQIGAANEAADRPEGASRKQAESDIPYLLLRQCEARSEVQTVTIEDRQTGPTLRSSRRRGEVNQHEGSTSGIHTPQKEGMGGRLRPLQTGLLGPLWHYFIIKHIISSTVDRTYRIYQPKPKYNDFGPEEN